MADSSCRELLRIPWLHPGRGARARGQSLAGALLQHEDFLGGGDRTDPAMMAVRPLLHVRTGCHDE